MNHIITADFLEPLGLGIQKDISCDVTTQDSSLEAPSHLAQETNQL